MNTKKQNKYEYLFVVQANYGFGDGWEDLCASPERKEAKEDLKAYRVNAPGTPYRMIFRRELNTQV